jgi:hypothetical protein
MRLLTIYSALVERLLTSEVKFISLIWSFVFQVQFNLIERIMSRCHLLFYGVTWHINKVFAL